MPQASALVPLWDRAAEWQRRLSMIDAARSFLYLSTFYIEHDAYGTEILLALRRALRNGTVWIEHSFAFRSRERLFIPAERWQQTRRAQYRRLALPTEAGAFLEPLLEQSQHAIARVADAAVKGELRVDDELHLTPLAAEEEDPKLTKLRAALDGGAARDAHA